MLVLLWLSRERPEMGAFDFTYAWTAGRALLQGHDPYRAVRAAQMPFGHAFAYPVPAALLAAPFGLLPLRIAAALFMGVSVGLFAYAVTAENFAPLILLASGPMYQSIRSAQWAPLVTAAGLLPGLLWIGVAKPNVWLGLLAFRSTRIRPVGVAFAIAAAVCLLGLLLAPGWPREWIASVRSPTAFSGRQYRAPIATLWGAPLALAALRWRRPEARLVLVMACVPQAAFFYDQLPALLVATTRRECLFVAGCSVVALALAQPEWAIRDDGLRSAALMPYVVVGIYWPALALVLSRRHSPYLACSAAPSTARSAETRARNDAATGNG